MGLEGFSGNEAILYHLQSPCRVKELGEFRPIVRDEWVPDAHAHRHMPPRHLRRGRPGHRAAPADVEQRRRDLAVPAERADGGLLPQRRGRRGDLRPRGQRHARDDLRRPPVQERRLRRDPARHDVPVPARRGRAPPPRVRDAGADRDPEALPERLRAADGARALLPPRHPPADGAEDDPRARRVPAHGARPRRLPGLRHRLPPVRRRRLGRVPLPVDVLDPRLRADHRADPHAAAVAPDLPGPELRHLLVLPAQARLRPAGGADPVPPLESPVARR